MRRRGFALIVVLWVIAALTASSGSRSPPRAWASARASTAWRSRAATGRRRLSRYRPGALGATSARRHGLGGFGAWDPMRVGGPRRRVALNVNTADPEVLRRSLRHRPTRARWICCSGPRRAAVHRSRASRGVAEVDSSALALLTVDGPGSVNATRRHQIRLLDVARTHARGRRDDRRPAGRRTAHRESRRARVGPFARRTRLLLAHYGALARQLIFGAPEYDVIVRGWVEGTGGPHRLHATLDVLAVPLPDRLAVVQQRVS